MEIHRDAAASGTEENKAIATGFLDAIVCGDISRIEALLDPAAKWWVQGWGTIDRNRFLASLVGTIQRSSGRKMGILSVTAEDDRVSIAAEGEFLFSEGTYSNSYHYLFTIADGRIVAGREYLDTAIAARFFVT